MKVIALKDGTVLIQADPGCADRLINLLGLLSGHKPFPVSHKDREDAYGIATQIRAARMLKGGHTT